MGRTTKKIQQVTHQKKILWNILMKMNIKIGS